MHNRGFSLLEIVLSIGILALIVPVFISTFYLQSKLENSNNKVFKEIDIIEDFCTFVQLQNFSYMHEICNQNIPLFVINIDDNDITYRDFVAQEIWENTKLSNKENYTLKIEQITDVFAKDGKNDPYIPLMCTLKRLSDNENDQGRTFVTVKLY